MTRRRHADLSDALRASGVSQRHTADAAAWRLIAESLAHAPPTDPVRRVIIEGRGSTPELLSAVQRTSKAGTPLYPLLQGPKIRVMWIRLLVHPGGAVVEDLDQLPVAVDVQVRRITEHLGLTATQGQALERARTTIQDAWQGDVQRDGAVGPGGLNGTAAALDPALWFYAKWGCSHCDRVGAARSIGRACAHCDLTPETDR